jgi:adenine-specific DNA-methyltransferase
VGAAFRRRGWDVISNDIQRYAYALNRHYIENSPPLDEGLVERLDAAAGEDGFIYNNYCLGSGSGRNYFTDENGRKCDAVRLALDRQFERGRIGEDEFFYCLAALIESLDKVANTASVYGAFLKHVKASAGKAFKLTPPEIVRGARGKVYCGDISEIIRRVRGDVLYLDPPYNARQYCANYHILETVARYDSPMLRGVSGLRDCSGDGQKSAFCSKRAVASAFEDVMANAGFKYIFLSYNNEGLMSLETIRGIMGKYGKYERFAQVRRRFRADGEEKRTHKAAHTTEYVHVCVK